MKKLENIGHILKDAIMIKVDVVVLYHSISNDAGLQALRKVLDNRENNKISTDDFTKTAELL